jgi:hypothetical protein
VERGADAVNRWLRAFERPYRQTRRPRTGSRYVFSSASPSSTTCSIGGGSAGGSCAWRSPRRRLWPPRSSGLEDMARSFGERSDHGLVGRTGDQDGRRDSRRRLRPGSDGRRPTWSVVACPILHPAAHDLLTARLITEWVRQLLSQARGKPSSGRSSPALGSSETVVVENCFAL